MEKQYVVVARSTASALFYADDYVKLNCIAAGGKKFSLTIQTHFENHGFDAKVPAALWIEAVGSAASLDEAVELFMNATLPIIGVLAFACNASMGQLSFELAYDESAHDGEHDFFQAFVEKKPLTVVPSRRIDSELVVAILEALERSSEKQRLHRAINQYETALKEWRIGHEIACVAHLYIASEALAVALVRERMREEALTEEELAQQRGVDIARRNWKYELQARVKLSEIFDGMNELYKTAKAISDSFEHGYGEFDHKMARRVAPDLASCVRSAIVKLLKLSPENGARISAKEYESARGPLELVRYFRGVLIGKPEDFAATDQEYPILGWTTKLSAVKFDANGRYFFGHDSSATVRIGKNAKLKPGHYEIWDGSVIKRTEPPKLSDS